MCISFESQEISLDVFHDRLNRGTMKCNRILYSPCFIQTHHSILLGRSLGLYQLLLIFFKQEPRTETPEILPLRRLFFLDEVTCHRFQCMWHKQPIMTLCQLTIFRQLSYPGRHSSHGTLKMYCKNVTWTVSKFCHLVHTVHLWYANW